MQGLSSQEVERLIREGKANRMPTGGEDSVWALVRRNVLTLFNLLNCLLAALLIWVQSYRNLLFMGVVIANAAIGLIQELRAKRTHDRLLLLSQSKLRTLRDGVETELAPQELVSGDVIRLRRGEQAPADAEVLDGFAQVNESLLTGESTPIPKQAGASLLSGCYVTEGEITARLTAVGAQSYAGRLQLSARKVKRPRSELMSAMQQIIRAVSIAIVPIGIGLYLRQRLTLHFAVQAAVPKVVAAVLGMIPEGLMLLTGMALAVGVIRLGKRRALVNELYGIESLARVDVVCLDKTGTLTSGQMTLEGVRLLTAQPREPLDETMRAFVAAFPSDDSPTMEALRKAWSADTTREAAAETVPFSSERKWSAARVNGRSVVLGAPEKTLTAHPQVLSLAQEQAALGLRVMAVLQTDAPLRGETLPDALEPLALLMLGDELRADACDTLAYFAEQGVALKVISGDSPLTVAQIAARAGLPNADHAVDCSALAQPIDYDALARDCAVFGRVSPEDKRELIGALKRQGHSVAMIGDGVNDIPALKAADCSIAMAGGSDAACRVAQLTLLDADFAAVPHILLEGRRVINNITRASALFLIKNIFSFLLALATLVLPYAYPFSPIQLTLISSLTIGFPSFVLALQPNRERVRGRFLRNVIRRALPGGATVALLCVAAMALLSGEAETVVSTVCVLIAAVSGICTLFATCLPPDKIRAALVTVCALAVWAAMSFVPKVFYLVPLSGAALWTAVGACAAAPLLLWALTALLRPHGEREPLRAEG